MSLSDIISASPLHLHLLLLPTRISASVEAKLAYSFAKAGAMATVASATATIASCSARTADGGAAFGGQVKISSFQFIFVCFFVFYSSVFPPFLLLPASLLPLACCRQLGCAAFCCFPPPR